jgi:hypothetical protein
MPAKLLPRSSLASTGAFATLSFSAQLAEIRSICAIPVSEVLAAMFG